MAPCQTGTHHARRQPVLNRRATLYLVSVIAASVVSARRTAAHPPTIPFVSFNSRRIRACSNMSITLEGWRVTRIGIELPSISGSRRGSQAGCSKPPIVEILQFMNVARPVVIREQLQRIRWNAFDVSLDAARAPARVGVSTAMLLTPLPQGRNS